MSNIKVLLVEKERAAYMSNDPVLAKFMADTLDYIVGLENQINAADAEIERLEGKSDENKEAIRGVLKSWR
jgi:ERCC4-type nuclease